MSQFSGGSSVPKISAVPLTRRSLRGESLATSIRSSLSRSNFTWRIVDADVEPAMAGAPGAAPPYAICIPANAVCSGSCSSLLKEKQKARHKQKESTAGRDGRCVPSSFNFEPKRTLFILVKKMPIDFIHSMQHFGKKVHRTCPTHSLHS